MNNLKGMEETRHGGPHLGALAIVYTVLFMAALCAVSGFGIPFGVRAPWFPGPWEPSSLIVSYFQTHTTAVMICAALQFGAMIPLGIYTATVVSRLRFLGVKAAGPYIALFGGFLTVFDTTAGHVVLWTMSRPAVAQNAGVLTPLYFLVYGFGGVGFSVPMGLLIAGIAIPSAFQKLLPKWLVVFGLVLAAAGELSWLHLMLFPHLLYLIPLVRFPAFVWLIAVGFQLAKSKAPILATA
jgi:hypothetical protein